MSKIEIEISETILSKIGSKGDPKSIIEKLVNDSFGPHRTEGKRKSAQSPFLQEIKDIYLGWYRTTFTYEYQWQGKDSKALGQMVQKLKSVIKQKSGATVVPADEVIRAFRFILLNLPDWYKNNNADLNTLNGHFNAILQQIRSNESTRKTNAERISQKYAGY